MYDHPHVPDYPAVAPFCYFSIAGPPSAHFSIETPSVTPISEYSPHTFADPSNPLLAFRPTALESMSSSSDASRLLQLQTSAANRPSTELLQHRASVSSSNSSDSISSSRSSSVMSHSTLSCCRCRRESLTGMIQFGTNIYYCSHCARMVGYSAG
ncbi:hypothetical protein EK21DRAFT_56673 [Setomelanomma holmii]|uniref:Uncharacterized protein n=1 Tax=Setomelanomma holmii TaxID=210430 RepID=A0A9P4LS31_9PLEO|nr:hypothetical protein EK21DRAFT_56673 [Setomelanomma holmii]